MTEEIKFYIVKIKLPLPAGDDNFLYPPLLEHVALILETDKNVKNGVISSDEVDGAYKLMCIAYTCSVNGNSKTVNMNLLRFLVKKRKIKVWAALSKDTEKIEQLKILCKQDLEKVIKND